MMVPPQCPRCLRHHSRWEVCANDYVKLAEDWRRRQRVKQHAQPELTYQEHQQAVAKRKGKGNETENRS